MKYWDWLEQFHQKIYSKYPNGQEGLKAVHLIRSFFEQIGIEKLSKNHPLNNRLGIGMLQNYSWLVQYAQKLITASQLSGFEGVARRFSTPTEYIAANAEIETALKLHLGGLDVSFSKEEIKQTICDLNVKIGGEVVRIEVSSLNPPDEEMRIEALQRHISLSFIEGVAAGGFVSGVKSAEKLEDLLKQIDWAIHDAKVLRKVIKCNQPGVATIYFAPDDMVDQMPADSRRHFRIVQPPSRSIEERIIRKFDEKDKQMRHYKESWVLFLYMEIMDRKSVSNLFDFSMDDVGVTLASYPKLSGLVLVVPHLGIQVASAVKTEDLKIELRESKLFLETEVSPYQYESSLIWKNLHADQVFPEKFAHALECYSSNLSKLSPLQESFAVFKES